MTHLDGLGVEEILGRLNESDLGFFLQPLLDIGDAEVRGFVAHVLRTHMTLPAAQEAFKTTAYWKNTNEAQKQWDSLTQAEREARVRERSNWIMLQYEQWYGAEYIRQNGITADRWDIKDWAAKIEDGRVSEFEFIFTERGNATRNPGTPAGIAYLEEQERLARLKKRPQEIAEELWQQARGDYFVTVSKEAATDWANRIITGQASYGEFNDFLRAEAKALYPKWATQIENGMKPQTLFSPVLDLAARELEMTPEAVIGDDRIWGQILRTASGELESPSASQWIKYIRSLPEWARTSGAQRQATELASSFGKIFGGSAL